MNKPLVILGKLVAGLLLGALTLACVAYFLVNSSLARRAMAQRLSAAMPKALISLAGLELDALPVEIDLHGLALGDPDAAHPLWSAAHLGLSLDPWTIPGEGPLHVTRAHADGVALHLAWDEDGTLQASRVLEPRPRPTEEPVSPRAPTRPVVVENLRITDSRFVVERGGWLFELEGLHCEGRLEAPTPLVDLRCGWRRGVLRGPQDSGGVEILVGPAELGHLKVQGEELSLEGLSLNVDGQRFQGGLQARWSQGDARLPELTADFQGAAGSNVLAALGQRDRAPMLLHLNARGTADRMTVDLQIGDEFSRLRLARPKAADGDVLPRFSFEGELRLPGEVTGILSGNGSHERLSLALRAEGDGKRVEFSTRDLTLPSLVTRRTLLVEQPELHEFAGALDEKGLSLRAGASLRRLRAAALELDAVQLATEGQARPSEGLRARLRGEGGAGEPSPRDIEEMSLSATLLAGRVAVPGPGLEILGLRLPKAEAAFSWKPAGHLRIKELRCERFQLGEVALSGAAASLDLVIEWPQIRLDRLVLSSDDAGNLTMTGTAEASFAGFQLALPARFAIELSEVALEPVVGALGERLALSPESRALLSGHASGHLVVEGDLKKPESLRVSELDLTVRRSEDRVRVRLTPAPEGAGGARGLTYEVVGG